MSTNAPIREKRIARQPTHSDATANRAARGVLKLPGGGPAVLDTAGRSGAPATGGGADPDACPNGDPRRAGPDDDELPCFARGQMEESK